MIQSTAPARGQNGTRRVVLAEPVGAVDGEQLREPRAGTIDPALDRPYRALADRSRLLNRCRRPDCNHGGLERHQLVGERGQFRDLSVGEAKSEDDVGALHIAEITHPAAKGPEDVHPRGGGERRQQADERLTCRLLRPCRDRPRRRGAAEKRDELAASHTDHGDFLPCAVLARLTAPRSVCRTLSLTNAPVPSSSDFEQCKEYEKSRVRDSAIRDKRSAYFAFS